MAFDKDKVLDISKRLIYIIESRKATTAEAVCTLTLVLKLIIDADEIPVEAAQFLALKIIHDIVGEKVMKEVEPAIVVPAAPFVSQ